MQGGLEAASILGMFLLRLGLPLAVTIALAWALRRLDARWQAEAAQARLMALDVSLVALSDENVDSRPCWEQRGCTAERRTRCPAYARPAEPCWLARMDSEDALPETCPACALFHATRAAHIVAGD